jgi:hypothetical protein
MRGRLIGIHCKGLLKKCVACKGPLRLWDYIVISSIMPTQNQLVADMALEHSRILGSCTACTQNSNVCESLLCSQCGICCSLAMVVQLPMDETQAAVSCSCCWQKRRVQTERGTASVPVCLNMLLSRVHSSTATVAGAGCCCWELQSYAVPQQSTAMASAPRQHPLGHIHLPRTT